MQRYDSYKNSGVKWLGEIPGHWETKKSKYLWKESFSVSENGNEELLSVSQYDGVTPAKGDSRSESLKSYKIVSKNDLVINIMLAWLGGLGVSDYDGLVSPAYCIYKICNDSNPKYLHYLYKTPLYLAEFARHSSGVVPSRWRMYTDDFGQVISLLPPKKEQDAIVDYLDEKMAKIDAAIAQQQKMIDLLNERKQIIINRAVTKGLNPNAKMKDSGVEWIGEIPEGWEINKLKNLCKMFGRIGFRGYSASDLVEEGEGAITLSPTNFDNGKLQFNNCSYLSWEKYFESPEIMVNPGDIVFVKTASIGKTAYVDSLPLETTVNPQILVIKDISINGKFLSFYLQSSPMQGWIKATSNGSTILTIPQSTIGKYPIILPSIEEQNEIVKTIETEFKSIEKAKDIVIKRISLLQERKQIIINEVVTGKVKVV